MKRKLQLALLITSVAMLVAITVAPAQSANRITEQVVLACFLFCLLPARHLLHLLTNKD